MPDEMIAYSAARHPAQHRARVSLTALFFGLFTAPIVWAGNLIVTYALATHACYPGHGPLDQVINGFGFAWPLILATYLITLVLCAGAFLVSLRTWRITGNESHGHYHHLVEVGEGRTRYLSIIGMAFSVIFFTITVAGAIVLAILPLCTR
jgi:hypothetical protein